MGWINALYDTYENNKELAGVRSKDQKLLFPVGHSTAIAQIEVTIDDKGNFLRAEELAKEEGETLIPVTEDSMGRSSGVAPHPLNDNLQHLDGNYGHYLSKHKEKGHNAAYLEQLENWEASPFSDEKLTAVLTYLKKNQLISDLIKAKILEIGDDGLFTKKKISNIPQDKAFVRFSVEPFDYAARTYQPKTWLDQQLQQKFIDYAGSTQENMTLCCVSGEEVPAASKHPAKIRNSGDKARLISSNDTSGYTYRGRFRTSEECVSIGYDTSQKAHSALRWLIAKQGYRNGSANIVAWSIHGFEIPNLMKDTEGSLGTSFGLKHSLKKRKTADIATNYAERLNNAIRGYKDEIGDNERIVVMSIDTADGSQQGRMAINFYQELASSTFFKYISDWHSLGEWEHFYKRNEDGKVYPFIGVPAPRDMALAAYGVERTMGLDVDDKLMKNTIERILPCIITGKEFPYDLMRAAVLNASRPLMMGAFSWQKVFSITCTMIVKVRKKRKGETWTMSLEKDNNNRSYVFGRLLALADHIEYITYDDSSRSGGRITNAKRYWNAFSKRPAKSWKIIREKLIPYINKLSGKQRGYYENYLDEVTNLLGSNQYDNSALNELYILGYDHQRKALWTKKEELEQNESEAKE